MSLLGDNIRYLRMSAGKSLEQFGKHLGNYTKSTVHNWESGKSEPDIDILEKISSIYGITLNNLLYSNLDYLQDDTIYKSTLSNQQLAVLFKACIHLLLPKHASDDPYFNRGYNIINNILSHIPNNLDVTLDINELIESSNAFSQSYKSTHNHEALANCISVYIFISIMSFPNSNDILKANASFFSNNRHNLLEIIEFRNKLNLIKSTEESKDNLSDSLLKYTKLLLGELRKTKYVDLAYFYMAELYIYNLIDNENNLSANQSIGFEMMSAFADMGNKYAENFMECIAELFE